MISPHKTITPTTLQSLNITAHHLHWRHPLQVLSVSHSSLTDQALSLQEGEVKALEIIVVIVDADKVESNADNDAQDDDHNENTVLSRVQS